jgi:hypothetical protein
MTPDQRIELADSEVILHSPAGNRHLDATKRIFRLMDTFADLHQLGEVKSEKVPLRLWSE